MQRPSLILNGAADGSLNAAFRPVVLAIHGSASSGRQWQKLQELLDGQAKVIAPDLNGYGQAADESGDRLAALSQRVTTQTARIHLVAHSFGGAVALKLAHAHPDRIASVTLYDPVVPRPDDRDGQRLPPKLDCLWQRSAAGSADALMQTFFDFWATEATWSDLSPRQRARLMSYHAGLCRDMAEITSGHWAIPQHTYRGPITLLRGEASPDVTAEMAGQIACAHPNTTFSTVSRLGHFAPLTHPDALNAHVVAALGRNGAAVDLTARSVTVRAA